MKINQINAMKESLQGNNYFIWKVEFQDGTSSNVKIRSDETSKEDLEKHFGKSIDKIIYSWGQHSPDSLSDRDTRREYHAQQDRLERGSAKGAWATPDTFNEAGLGGINRAPSPVNVSYDKVLDEVFAKYSAVLNELSQEKMKAYKGAAASNMNRPLRKMAKTADTGVPAANKKITQKRQQGPLTFEERLAEYVEEAFDSNAFTDLLSKQDAEVQAAKPKAKVIPIDFHGWTIKYRNERPSEWTIYDKKNVEKKKGLSPTQKDAISDAQEWITAGGGTEQQSTKNVTIDFNVDFAKQLAPGGETFYATIDKDNGKPVLIFSTMPQNGLKKSHIRTQANKVTSGTTKLPMISMSPAEANAMGLQPNGRYVLGSKEPIDDNIAMFELIYQGIVQGKGDMVKLGVPGLTVAHPRD